MKVSMDDWMVSEWELPYKEGQSLVSVLSGCKFVTAAFRGRGNFTVIFNKQFAHVEIYRRKLRGCGIISAGFIIPDVFADGPRVKAVGKSTSIEGAPCATDEDTRVINIWLQEKLRCGI